MREIPLRSGFTTGTCAAVAAKAAAVMLFTGIRQDQMDVMTPKGICARIKVETVSASKQMVCCRVKKDAGDDPDITNGVWVYASVMTQKFRENLDEQAKGYYFCGCGNDEADIYITGGEGIGYVTKPGLSCPIGCYAINPVPQKMIRDAVLDVCMLYARKEPVAIQISIPQGIELACKTFNPKLGIKGGISVLGSSGIVEPMSEQALLDTILLEIHMKAVESADVLVLTPGNYGEEFLQKQLQISLEHAIKCSNFIGFAIEASAKEGIGHVLLVGHAGKLIKIAGGVFNTHSKYGDRRMEILADCLKAAAPEKEWLIQDIGRANTTEEAFEALLQDGCIREVSDEVIRRMQLVMGQWTKGCLNIDIVLFTKTHGILGMSKGARSVINRLSASAADSITGKDR